MKTGGLISGAEFQKVRASKEVCLRDLRDAIVSLRADEKATPPDKAAEEPCGTSLVRPLPSMG